MHNRRRCGMFVMFANRAVATMRPPEVFDIHRASIRHIVEANQHRNARVFGSVARRDDKGQSDIDLLVDTTAATTLFDTAAIELELRQLIGVPVHVTTTGALRGRVREQILAEALAV
jgi:uncharacterized protein